MWFLKPPCKDILPSEFDISSSMVVDWCNHVREMCSFEVMQNKHGGYVEQCKQMKQRQVKGSTFVDVLLKGSGFCRNINGYKGNFCCVCN